MKTFVRDSTVVLKFRFQDETGAVRSPTAANLTLSYLPHESCDPTFITYPLVAQGTDWVYEWDSSVAQPGVVAAHAETTDDPTSAVDVEFRLKANRANRELVGEW